ncbi:lipopolysaccharide biosynthesis protein [Arthrobacter bambusae]|uniref:O-antigen/teichoic acid export membrane protein n=1 Tax=Arthrobacter bambusae TaxID=1338426 RepID=A0ABT9X7E1_9MICC|nr:lipopolysaccharide biosynthesis protein [Arthrobacter bambusae]MDQ0129457.1 O-antigen/teichoic acid export membrane protein [Arthrobacter bambusae]MDQ0180930.1 O-antigen/teichoic acid export membrane protein [Arthrobacter bambusae]
MAGTFLQVILISRALNLDEAGVVFVLFTLMNLAATMGRFGTDNLVLRRIASGQHGHAIEARWLRAACWAASSIAGALLSGLLTTGLLPLPASAHGVPEAACVGLMTVFYALSVFAGAVLRGSGRLVAGILAELGLAPWLTILFVGAQMLLGKPTVLTVLLALLAAGAITALWALKSAQSAISFPGKIDWVEGLLFIQKHLSSLASLMGTSLLFFALVWVPQLSLGFVGTGSQVAQYTAAARIASFISIFPSIQTSYLAPKFAALAYSGRKEELSEECGRAALMAMVVAVPLLVTISYMPGLFLRLFGGGYQDAAIPTLVLCIGAYVTLFFGQVNTLMVTAGLEHPALVLNAILLVAVAGVCLLGAPTIGVVGVSIASAAGSAVYAMIATLVVSSKVGANPTLVSYFQYVSFQNSPTVNVKSG